jgi:hypothetical protein
MKVSIIAVGTNGPEVAGEFHLTDGGKGIAIYAPEENLDWLEAMLSDTDIDGDPEKNPAGWLREMADVYGRGSLLYAVLSPSPSSANSTPTNLK